VAASTHDGEEYLAAKAHILLKKKYHNLLTIIIPRYIDNINKIKKKLSVLDLKIITHSSKQHDLKNIDIYIVDTFGESKNFYKIAPSVFLGKSIYNKGGQNPLEPAKYACNVLHGPNIENFKDVYKYLNKLKISKKVNSLDDLVSNIKFRKNYINSKKLKRLGANIYKQTIKELNTYLN
jgi:3-deoxy-D-manno-octulosonic-acid transferase